jgi:NADH:ubiquinone oxidoreductase subunit F (NADH-binding)/NADH:ubiquinone oxidoreductase subunit E
MLFNELHKIQSNPANKGYLPEAELRQLAQQTGTPLYRIQEVASYFPHFHLQQPPKVQVQVCRDMACHLRGSEQLVEQLESKRGKLTAEQLTIEGVSCLGRCDRGPVACVNHHFYSKDALRELPQAVRDALAGRELRDNDPSPASSTDWQIDPYPKQPDYGAARNFIERPDAERFLKELETSGLLGMGGAGAPAWRKWTDVFQATAPDGQKYVVCNGDESEPGTFKDREILLRKPHLVVEGVVLAGLVVGATHGCIFIRHEYPEQIKAVRRAIAEAEALGVCGAKLLGSERSFWLEVVESPGGYICGEQGALIEALEGKRAQPRNRPPQLETNGLWNKPTLLSNVETFAWAVPIARHGGAWYRDLGVNGFKGQRFFSISGDVKRPGVYEVPIGLTLGELVDRHAGGTLDGRPPLAIAPSGPSGGFLPLHLPVPADRAPEGVQPRVGLHGTTVNILDLPLDLGLFRQLGLMLGAGIVVYGQGRDMLDQALNCARFFRNESCGKCVPCRVGSQKLVEIAESAVRSPEVVSEGSAAHGLVRELAHAMEMTSICGLGVSAPNPLMSWLRHFPAEQRRAEVSPDGRTTSQREVRG